MPSSYAVQPVDDEITLHRPCFGADDPMLLYALRSNHENHRASAAEDANAFLATGVSMFSDPEALLRMARRRPARLGTHIMTLILLPDFGIHTAETGPPGHHSVWGAPHRLLDCITAIRPTLPTR
jgi:hypothetical protein